MGDSTGSLHHKRAIDGVECLLDQLITRVAIEVEKVDHSLREILLHLGERILGGDSGAVRLRPLNEGSYRPHHWRKRGNS
jgi:hypothetical protein